MKNLNAIDNFIRAKRPNILITNICNLSCGGCSQQCGYIPKEKLWNIPIEQLEWNVKLLIDVRGEENVRDLGIFGGEPTIHPQYENILKMLSQFKKTHFQIYTNGIKTPNRKWNHTYSTVPKNKNSYMNFRPTSIAPQDVYKIQDKKFYWEKAKKDCDMYKKYCSIIYNNKAYFCEPAAAWDVMTGEDHGWPLKWGEDPFVVTHEQVEKQALNFCYRCGWCFSESDLKKYGLKTQRVKDPTIVSEINLPINKTKKSTQEVKTYKIM